MYLPDFLPRKTLKKRNHTNQSPIKPTVFRGGGTVVWCGESHTAPDLINNPPVAQGLGEVSSVDEYYLIDHH